MPVSTLSHRCPLISVRALQPGCKSATGPMKKAQARLADSTMPIFRQQQQEQQPHGMSNVSAAANGQAQTVSSNPLYNFTVSAEDVPMRAVAKPFDVVCDATGKLITKGCFVNNQQKQSTQYEGCTSCRRTLGSFLVPTWDSQPGGGYGVVFLDSTAARSV